MIPQLIMPGLESSLAFVHSEPCERCKTPRKDQADIVELVKAGANPEDLRSFVERKFPHRMTLLNQLILQAAREE